MKRTRLVYFEFTKLMLFGLFGLAVGSTQVQARPFGYVGNYFSNSVSVIDIATNTVVDTIPVGPGPSGLAVTPDGAFLYVVIDDAFSEGGHVSVIDIATNTVVANVPVGSRPIEVAITPDGAFAYVTNENSDAVSVIETASNTVVATIPGIRTPFGVRVIPNGAFVYVTSYFGRAVYVIETATNTIVATLPVGDVGPREMAFTPDGGLAYVSGNPISVIDTSTLTVVATIRAFGAGIAITPDGRFAYATYVADETGNPDNVGVIDVATNTFLEGLIRVGRFPWGVTITPDGAFAYVPNLRAASVSVIDTASNTVIATIPVGNSPHYVAITPF